MKMTYSRFALIGINLFAGCLIIWQLFYVPMSTSLFISGIGISFINLLIATVTLALCFVVRGKTYLFTIIPRHLLFHFRQSSDGTWTDGDKAIGFFGAMNKTSHDGLRARIWVVGEYAGGFGWRPR
jgi:hypothetical protein